MGTQIKKSALSDLINTQNEIVQCFSDTGSTSTTIKNTTPKRKGLLVMDNNILYASGKWDGGSTITWKPINTNPVVTIKFNAKFADGSVVTTAHSAAYASLDTIPYVAGGNTISVDSRDSDGEFTIHINTAAVDYYNGANDLWIFKLNDISTSGTISIGYENGDFPSYAGAIYSPLKGQLSDVASGGIKNLGDLIVNPYLIADVNVSIKVRRGNSSYPTNINVYGMKLNSAGNLIQDTLIPGGVYASNTWTGPIPAGYLPYIKVLASWSGVTYSRIYQLPCKNSINTVSIQQDNIETDTTYWTQG